MVLSVRLMILTGSASISKIMAFSMFIFELMMIKVGQMRISTSILRQDHREEIILTTQVLRMVLGLVGPILVVHRLKRIPEKKAIANSA